VAIAMMKMGEAFARHARYVTPITMDEQSVAAEGMAIFV